MPELPEVESAVVELRRHAVGRRIERLVLHHAALRRRLDAAALRSVVGARVVAIRRRGKHQFIDLDDGRVLHAHFRMTGSWVAGPDVVASRHPRATLAFDDGTAIVLDDPRALSSIELRRAGDEPLLGPDADDPAIDVAMLHEAIARRRISIKALLLDQTVLAGLGNIYAAESLWRARIDPRRLGSRLDRPRVARLLAAIRAVLARATGARYAEGARFSVYDREGRPCRRCKSPIRRIVQGGRSTYFCPGCQTD